MRTESSLPTECSELDSCQAAEIVQVFCKPFDQKGCGGSVWESKQQYRTHHNQQAVIEGLLKYGKTITELAHAQKMTKECFLLTTCGIRHRKGHLSAT